MNIKLDKFVVSILFIIGLAYVFPQWGTASSPIPINTISTIGISLIFFFYGLKLSPTKIKEGLKNWKLHVLIQGTTFLFFPLIVLLFKPLLQTAEQELLWLAIFFLAALPSTVSSSVVMVSVAKGNIPAAIFNASISGIIGILVTPLWMGIFVNSADANFDFSSIYLQLIGQIVVPVVLGLILQKYLGEFAQKYSKQLTLFDKSIILLIIYKSFASSFEEKIFSSVSLVDLLVLLGIILLLFAVVFFGIKFVSKRLGFTEKDQITATFCGTKKSLVHGTVFSKIVFGNMATLGIILLPLMIFHATQILIISIIAGKMGRNKSA
ncbi:bile acid:sodium symporter family protein [Cellulophaga sp. L1A9]|uniref:bile acid:sodium symporter family protein n=1 Tax=Cellulophaga sp. L1A9 TaxID=2686362 RepID=UPI00131C597F|nr:bile acid:sodium symporter family protein [Cellulophaga sp. L1A9]